MVANDHYLRTRAEKTSALIQAYFGSLLGGFRSRHAFDDLKTFCLFIGYPRSGHSLIGSMLNAHHNATIAHELDILKYVDFGFSRSQLLSLILDRDIQFSQLGRKWTGYNYAIPNQYQGSYDKLLVIGDKKGGGSTIRLRKKPKLLDHLSLKLRLPIRLIHVTRNPYDNIATMALRDDRGLRYSIERYSTDSSTNAEIIERVGRDSVLTVAHEDLFVQPARVLEKICAFLSLDAPKEFVNACTSIINDKPRETRFLVEWTATEIVEIEERCIRRHAFLGHYKFDA